MSPTPSSPPQPASTPPPLIDLDAPVPRISPAAKDPFFSILQPQPVPAQTHTQRMMGSPHHRHRHRHHDDRPPSHQLDGADIDRFAMLFSPATPPASPTPLERERAQPRQPLSRSTSHRGIHRRGESDSSDGDFGPFVSVPPHQDPLSSLELDTAGSGETSRSRGTTSTGTGTSTSVAVSPWSNTSFAYFDQFTRSAQAASARNRRGVLDELLTHQDDPMYFLTLDAGVHGQTRTVQEQSSPPLLDILKEESESRRGSEGTSTPLFRTREPTHSTHAPVLQASQQDSIADAIAAALGGSSSSTHAGSQDLLHSPSRTHGRGHRGLARNPSLSSLGGRAHAPLPPCLSENVTPPSASLPDEWNESDDRLETERIHDDHLSSHSSPPSPPLSRSTTGLPAQASLSRISSSWASLLAGGRHGRSGTHSWSTSSPSPSAFLSSSLPASSFTGPASKSIDGRHSASITHGSPFAATTFMPPSGAPGFTGDHMWDHGYSDTLEGVDGAGELVGRDTNGDKRIRGVGSTGGKKMRVKGVSLSGRGEGTAEVLTEELANELRPHLPALMRLPRTWTLLYSVDQHGISLNTLYSLCAPRVPTKGEPSPPQGALVAVRDEKDGVFGAWVEEGVQRTGGKGYYGSGEAFLWRHAAGDLEVFKWTGQNSYVALCEPEFVAFGGGEGHYGLCIDGSLLRGSSAACPTFGNPVLCGGPGGARKDIPFECVGLEVWGVGPG